MPKGFFERLGSGIDAMVTRAAQATNKAGSEFIDFTFAETHRQNEQRVGLDNLHDLYRDATSHKLKLEGPAIDTIKHIVGNGEGQIPPKQFLKIMSDRYGEKRAAEKMENWGLLD